MIFGLACREREGDSVETEAAVPYKGFRFPAEVISHAVWLYYRFLLSFREVEELLARGIAASHEAVRQWCDRFGPQYAAGLRRRKPKAGDKWGSPGMSVGWWMGSGCQCADRVG